MLTDLLIRLDAVEKRREDPRFYFVWHKRLFDVLFALLIANFLVWAAVSFLAITRPEALTHAQTVDGKTVQLSTVDEPLYNNQAVEEWAENAIKIAYNYDFSNSVEQISKSKTYFEPEAWDLFAKNLEESTLKKVKEKDLQVSIAVDKARVNGNPIMIGGVTAWKIEIPAMISYVSASEKETRNVLLEVVVKRQITYTNPKGLWITKLNEGRK